MVIFQILQDASFSAIAAIGFAAISRPPRCAYAYCAAIAAAGHSLRFMLMDPDICQMHIVPATALAALVIGVLAVLVSPRTRTPAEAYLYPALLPMIPGIYAYRSFGALVMCLYNGQESTFGHYFYLFAYNGLTCGCIMLAMAIGATAPMFLMKRISFTATRQSIHGQNT